MSFGKFIKDKLVYVFAQLLIIAFVGLIMQLFKCNVFSIVFTTLVIFLISMTVIFIEFFRRYSFYKTLDLSLHNLDKKFFISELIDRPDFFEGELLYDVIKEATKSMNDEVGKYKISEEEYKEYIETWIHEIKTPIAGITLICDNNRSDITRGILEETNKINEFVEQVLFYARSTAVEKDYSIRDINLGSIIRDVVKKHSRQMIENKIEIKLSGIATQVYSDPKWLDFIIGQILVNSIKYKRTNISAYNSGETNIDNSSSYIEFHVIENNTQVILFIRDNGIGIPEKDLPRVFDKGFTGENGRKFAKSTGIGLYLCKRLCEKMNLGISLSSVEGKGTEVKIVIPKDFSREVMF